MRLLDLFCGAGGASAGYAAAGFTVTGVDINPMPRYPFQFIQGDALEYAAAHGHEYDVIAASPPCQAYSRAGRTAGQYRKDDHPDLIDATRELLQSLGKPYAIENVAGAPLRSAVMLCGSMFGLKVYRHRYFEILPEPLFVPAHRPHADQTPPAGRGLSPKGFMSITSGGIRGVSPAERHAAMGIDWMTHAELNQAIPPAYTQWVGNYLMKELLFTQETHP
jgi:DNA (cytosine-5)-methyltransferase 1